MNAIVLQSNYLNRLRSVNTPGSSRGLAFQKPLRYRLQQYNTLLRKCRVHSLIPLQIAYLLFLYLHRSLISILLETELLFLRTFSCVLHLSRQKQGCLD